YTILLFGDRCFIFPESDNQAGRTLASQVLRRNCREAFRQRRCLVPVDNFYRDKPSRGYPAGLPAPEQVRRRRRQGPPCELAPPEVFEGDVVIAPEQGITLALGVKRLAAV